MLDALSIMLRIVRECIESTGVPPDTIQDALLEAEHRSRRALGGAVHHVSRLPSTKSRILDLAAAGLTPQQIGERLSVTARYVRKVINELG